ncbi:MAG: tRNA epoxyqueuosine(34) reductase QueG [Anaerolineales bacterium]|nr:tRNA epoxyqueuosine(34) reductase QueG [Anaerolineales bacterium]
MSNNLKQAIKEKARQLGFILTGVTSSEPLEHFNIFQDWINKNYHGEMNYLSTERSLTRRADPKQILPECKSILVLAIPYAPLSSDGRVGGVNTNQKNIEENKPPYRDHNLQIASYALGDDYHDVLPDKLKAIVKFIEEHLGKKIPNRYYTDSGPILERELAQRAGLGWIGKNSMLINPQAGSTFFLAEILLGIELEPDQPFSTDHCGTCNRCISACPTNCILPDRTLDSNRCISYLTIEHKTEIPENLREQIGNWIFGCDICQQVCPWNRFSQPADSAFETKIPLPVLSGDLLLDPATFNQRFKKSPVKRTKRRGYLRNIAIAIGNKRDKKDIPMLEKAMQDDEPLIQSHAKWALEKINNE